MLCQAAAAVSLQASASRAVPANELELYEQTAGHFRAEGLDVSGSRDDTAAPAAEAPFSISNSLEPHFDFAALVAALEDFAVEMDDSGSMMLLALRDFSARLPVQAGGELSRGQQSGFRVYKKSIG